MRAASRALDIAYSLKCWAGEQPAKAGFLARRSPPGSSVTGAKGRCPRWRQRRVALTPVFAFRRAWQTDHTSCNSAGRYFHSTIPVRMQTVGEPNARPDGLGFSPMATISAGRARDRSSRAGRPAK